MEFSELFLNLRQRLALSQVEMGRRIGITSNYVSLIESGLKTPSEAIVKHVMLLQRLVESGLYDGPALEKAGISGAKQIKRRIKVISWAHAGDAVNYEELPDDWQEEVCTDCTDPKAFGLKLEGDSMEGKRAPSFGSGDLLVCMPSKRPYSGCFVVSRFKEDGGILFRQLEMMGKTIRLAPLNERYPITQHHSDEIEWMYPVWGSWTQLWKG